MSAINQVTSSIISGNFTNEELDMIQRAITHSRAYVRAQVRNTLLIGDNVQFTSTKQGRQVRGFVKKIAIKYATVDTGMGLYKVPMNMLSLVEEEWTPENADYCDVGSRHHY